MGLLYTDLDPFNLLLAAFIPRTRIIRLDELGQTLV